MNYHRLSRADFEGYGTYEHDVQGVGQLPVINLGTFGTEEQNGLAHVSTAAKPGAKAALEAMVFNAIDAPEVGGKSGTAALILGSSGSPWVSQLVQQGYVVMIDKASVPSGNVEVVATDQAPSIVLFAGRPNLVSGAEWVIVDAAPAALAAAEALANGAPPPGTSIPGLPGLPGLPGTGTGNCGPGEISVGGQCFPTPPCPAGTQEVFGVCFPSLQIPGQPPVTQPPVTQPPVTQPPVTQPPEIEDDKVAGIGGDGKKLLFAGLLGVGALALAGGYAYSQRDKRKTGQRMAANRRNAYPKGWR